MAVVMRKQNQRRMCSDGSKIALAAVLVAMALPGVAQAQNDANVAQSQASAEDDQSGIQDIVVTAQRKEENLQDIPVAVTALTQADLENYQVRGFSSLNGIAPNVTTVNSVSGSGPTITIRGILGGNVSLGTDSGVALYIDGVILPRTTGASFEVADIERVEVLRGPQGTLYGRNATGGAINYITSAPKGRLYVKQEVSVGNLGLIRSKTRLDLPEFSGISISLNYLHDQRRGYTRNTAAGLTYNLATATAPGPVPLGTVTSVKDLGGRNSDAGMIAVRFAPEGSSLVADYKFDMSDAYYTNRAQQPFVNFNLGGLSSFAPTMVRADAVPMGFTTPEHTRVYGHNLTVTLDLSDSVQLKSISGLRGYKSSYSNDVLGGGFEGNPFLAPNGTFSLLGIIFAEKDRTFTQEAQISYKSDRFDGIAGAYYFHQRTDSYNPLYFFNALPTAANGVVPLGSSTIGLALNKSFAVFGQGTFHATSQLDFTAGVRYTNDRRNFTGSNPGAAATAPFSATFKHTDWMANLTFRPTDDITLYAKAGSGYISGGLNSSVNIPFNPEQLVQYEIGAKTDFFDRRLRLNFAAFHSDYKDLQTGLNDQNGRFYTQNIGKAAIDGFEFEAQAIPVDGLKLTANYGYTDFKYKEFFRAFGAGNVNITNIANPTTYRPKHNLNIGAHYDFAAMASGIKPSFNISGRWHSNMALYGLPAVYEFTQANPAYTAAQRAQLAAIDAFTTNNAVWKVDMRFTLADIPLGGAKAKIAAWGSNMLDTRTITNATSIAGFGVITGQFPEPRTFGVDLSVEF